MSIIVLFVQCGNCVGPILVLYDYFFQILNDSLTSSLLQCISRCVI